MIAALQSFVQPIAAIAPFMPHPSTLLLTLPFCLIPAAALAQTPAGVSAAAAPAAAAPPPAAGAPVQTAAAASAPAPAAAPSRSAARQQTMEQEDAEQEIVVKGQRATGSVIGDIPPEVTLTPADIRSYGVN